MSDVEKRKRGRPKKDGRVRNGRLDVRISPEEIEMLQFLREQRGESTTKIVCDALRTQYNLARYTSKQE